ncbi:MAG TPA: hypothetical protein PKL31_04975 [Fulvivirga sp.]|nr:hypothetical protein [Fulvivirga sp.]
MNTSKIESIGLGGSIQVNNLTVGANVQIGNRVKIKCDHLIIGDNVQILDDVEIVAYEAELGFNVKIEERVKIIREGAYFSVGENTFIGHDCKFTVPRLLIGEYATINNHCMFSGNEPLLLGHNAWIGQNCVLNSQQKLTIGNNFGLGMYSCVYTHGYFGELLEGCNIHKEEEVNIADDVWVLGQFNMISPGVNIENKALILNGTNVTSNVKSNSTVGGNPSKDLTDKLVPYKEIKISDKLNLMRKFISEWLKKNYNITTHFDNEIDIKDIGRIVIIDKPTTEFSPSTVIICTSHLDYIKNAPNNVSIFDLNTKVYYKTRSKIEIDFIRFMKSYRARFVPNDNSRILLK